MTDTEEGIELGTDMRIQTKRQRIRRTTGKRQRGSHKPREREGNKGGDRREGTEGRQRRISPKKMRRDSGGDTELERKRGARGKRKYERLRGR